MSPALPGMGGGRRPERLSTGAGRVLVVRLSALGDVIHTIPAVVALRGALGPNEIGWVVEAAYAELVSMVAGVDAVFPVRMKRWRRRLLRDRSEIAAGAGAIRRFGKGEVSIDFQGLMKSGLVARLSGARIRYCLDRAAIREKGALLFANRPVTVDRSRHVVEWNLQLARALAPSTGPVPHPDFEPFCAGSGEKLRKFAGSVVLLPGAGKPNKQWAPERFARLARHIGERALVVWGPGEEALAAEIARAGNSQLAPATNLRELAWLLRDAALVVGGDTGPLHLAAALGTKVVGLYGPTDPLRNGPYGQVGQCVDKFREGRSMSAIEVDEVIEMMEKAGSH